MNTAKAEALQALGEPGQKGQSSLHPRRIRVCVLIAVVCIACLVAALKLPAIAQEEGSTIQSFEQLSPVATVTVDAGTSLEDAGLPDTLRAVVALDEEELTEASFEQIEPEEGSDDDPELLNYEAPAGGGAISMLMTRQ